MPITLPDWMFAPAAAPAPPPPLDPMVAREQAIADNTRAEEALNDFIAAKHDALFEAPDAFYRKQGVDAIDAAPETARNLEELRGTLLDSLANDDQRRRLGDALDAQMQITREDMARHVTEQSLAWQRQTALDRIALLTKEAAYHHDDPDRVSAIGEAAATAARAHARVGDTPLDVGAEDAVADAARNGVLSAAMQAKLDKNAAPDITPVKASDATRETPQSGLQYASAGEAEEDPEYEIRKKEHLSPTPAEREKHHDYTHEILPPPVLGFAGLARGNAPAPTTLGPAKNLVPAPPSKAAPENPAKEWGKQSSLDDHVARHGAEVGASGADDYVAKAVDLRDRARRGEIPMKTDSSGVVRIYDPSKNLFGAYNDDGTVRTLFAPDPQIHGYPTNMDYWNSQPGS